MLSPGREHYRAYDVWCRYFIARMQLILPPELRAMVYGHLCRLSFPEPISCNFLQSTRHNALYRIPQSLRPDYFGLGMTELGETFYRQMNLVLEGPEYLDLLLGSDPLRAGVSIGKCIRRLKINYKIQPNLSRHNKFFFRGIDGLELLMKERRDKSFRLELAIHHNVLQEPVLEAQLTKAIQTMQHQGFILSCRGEVFPKGVNAFHFLDRVD